MTQLATFTGRRMGRRFKSDAIAVGGIVTSRLRTSGYISMCKRFDIAPSRCHVTEFTGFGSRWMIRRFVRVTVTPYAGAIGLYDVAVIERPDVRCPVSGDAMAGFANVRGHGMLTAFLRSGMATGTDTIGLQHIVVGERQFYWSPHTRGVTHTTGIGGIRVSRGLIRHRVTS